ncbi:hypothetical protein ACIBL6_47575 [Streptomyces sp. NPDC050400]|uniref:hypothetical protein n=1 Tax=Streptomyces sp. NPDC050400 TaxID=3365610 RepID=UPI0037B82490
MTTTLYELETREDEAGRLHPDEHLWTPDYPRVRPERLGFVLHETVHITGFGEEDEFPAGFLAVGHHRWATIIEAAAAYMDKIYDWRQLHTYPGNEQSDVIPQIPRAVHTHAVLIHHPHPDHPCGCAWDDQWRIVWAPATEPGAFPVTAMRHPAAPANTVDIPNPDDGAPAAWTC